MLSDEILAATAARAERWNNRNRPMPSVSLDNEEWSRVMAIIAQAPWSTANPLLLKIGEQLRQQQDGKMQETPAAEAQLASKGAH